MGAFRNKQPVMVVRVKNTNREGNRQKCIKKYTILTNELTSDWWNSGLLTIFIKRLKTCGTIENQFKEDQ